jgi:penicillin-binding protein 1C
MLVRKKNPDVSQYLRERGQIISKLPQHNQLCPSVASGEPIRIIYPSKNARLWLPRDVFGQVQKVILRAAHQVEDQTVFWYLDNLYLGDTSQNHTKVTVLSQGWHTLEVVDPEGNRDVITFYVNRYKHPG